VGKNKKDEKLDCSAEALRIVGHFGRKTAVRSVSGGGEKEWVRGRLPSPIQPERRKRKATNVVKNER